MWNLPSWLQELLDASNRDTWAWLPWIESCQNRFVPCTNAGCLDEAMHAWALKAWNKWNDNNQSLQAIQHSHDIVSKCRDFEWCPLNKIVAQYALWTKERLLDMIKDNHANWSYN